MMFSKMCECWVKYLWCFQKCVIIRLLRFTDNLLLMTSKFNFSMCYQFFSSEIYIFLYIIIHFKEILKIFHLLSWKLSSELLLQLKKKKRMLPSFILLTLKKKNNVYIHTMMYILYHTLAPILITMNDKMSCLYVIGYIRTRKLYTFSWFSLKKISAGWSSFICLLFNHNFLFSSPKYDFSRHYIYI